MRDSRSARTSRCRGFLYEAKVLLLGMLCASSAQAFELEVVDPAAIDPTTGRPEPIAVGYRWLIEEDTTYHTNPGQIDPHTLAVRFHASYAPVVAEGRSGDPFPTLDPNKHYFISVLPDSGFNIGGAAIAPADQDGTVTVMVQQAPLPTAQISIFVFEDNFPINNAPDLPEEHGLEGFTILVEDAGGRYGMSGGRAMQDAFGNPLGTTYNPDGSVDVMGTGVIKTGADGKVLIKNLVPGKYGIQVVPPPGTNWKQTTTIEGTNVIDAWVKANEPAFFTEFGPPGPHVFVGFVQPMNDTTVLNGATTISGQVVNLHNSRPPEYAFYNGGPLTHTNCWIGLNDLSVGIGRGVYAQACGADGRFTIPNVPPGSYQLAIWDDALDQIFAFYNVTVNPDGSCNTPNGSCNLLEVPVFQWFTRLEHHVFYDENENGFRDEGEQGIPEQAVNLRWRDGTLYQSMPTDTEGFVPFDEIFPFFHWLVTEVDYARFKATGATIIVDAGGPVGPDRGWDFPSRGVLNPQPQFCTTADAAATGCTVGDPLVNPNTGNNLSRTETGPVLTQAFQGFLGQTSIVEWGKKMYSPSDMDNAPYGWADGTAAKGPEDIDWNGNGVFDPAENGGISGIVYYATTRAESDPWKAVADPWEPGVPRVQVVLYQDTNNDKIIDDLDGDGGPTLADVDNHPFGWRDGTAPKGPEDIDRNGDGVFDYGDAIQIVATDSWDDNLPVGCQGEIFSVHGAATDCYDGLRNFNQVRPGVFDGGYAFNSYFPGGMANNTATEKGLLPAGVYIVEAVPPPGYKIVKEEDKNVDFGVDFEPHLLPPICVGDLRPVPEEFSLFPLFDENGDPVKPFGAGTERPLCDRRQIVLTDGKNAAADFFVFTEVPIAGHLVGFILDDLANEFDPTSPQFGEKYAPPWLPVSIRDWTGEEIGRVYSDEWGKYNALIPSTFSANAPMPSGMSPNMLITCMNDPGPIIDKRPGSPTQGQLITDPFFNRQYSQFCYTFQYMPGTTTYLDTPVLPVAAFAGPDQFPLDCGQSDGTPEIYSVSASGPGALGGPYVPAANGTYSLTIVSRGDQVQVPNPAYDGPGGTQPKTITRDYGFGDTQGSGSVTIGGVPLTVTGWTADTITATVPGGVATGQLVVTRDDGKSTVSGLTVTVGPLPVGRSIHVVSPSTAPGATPIQDAIDLAVSGDLILVAPGNYEELVIMWKPVQLQGWGAGSTVINAVKAPGEKLEAWRTKVQGLIDSGAIDLLPGQEVALGEPEAELLGTEEGAGILVLAKLSGANRFLPSRSPRIDGFTITGADNGGGIVVNGYASYLEISNNRVVSNQGTFSGGIRVGHPELAQNQTYVDSNNDRIRIHHNEVMLNGGLNGAGGGISLHTGADFYQVTYNFICGNFSAGDGGGIGHLGLSDGGLIANNTILFNQTFNQGRSVSGGGIFIGGGAPLVLGGLSPGSGSVKVVSNLIQGNLAGAGDGGGIRTSRVNGQDLAGNGNNAGRWYAIDILDNMIVNNVAGLAGGAISMQDTARINIIHNTVANNDSVATAGEAFTPGNPNQSNPQPAGIVSRAHSTALASAFGGSTRDQYGIFSNPQLVNNIIWHNRSFHFFTDPAQDPPVYGLQPDVEGGAAPVYWDLAVLGTATPSALDPQYSVLTDTAGYSATNSNADPMFMAEYFNGARNAVQELEFTTGIQVQPAFDEGGNFIDVRFGPLTLIDPATGQLIGDYHIQPGSPAADSGDPSVIWSFVELGLDYDGEPRPQPAGSNPDRGADEIP